MTKRFEYIIGKFWDTVSDEPLSFSKVEKILNDLSEENDQLKTELTELKASEEDNYNISDGLW